MSYCFLHTVPDTSNHPFSKAFHQGTLSTINCRPLLSVMYRLAATDLNDLSTINYRPLLSVMYCLAATDLKNLYLNIFLYCLTTSDMILFDNPHCPAKH